MPIIYVEGHTEFDRLEKPSEFVAIFRAAWALPSRAMTTIVEDSASKNKECTFYVLDIDKYDFSVELKLYNIFALPTVIKIRGGDTRGKIIGTVTRLQFAISTGLN